MNHPYLIQHGVIQRPLGAFRNQRVSQAVDLDYMGSSEFEFGALPKSFRAMEKMVELARLNVVPRFERGGKPLRVFHFFTGAEFQQYESWLHEIWVGKRRCKERTRFHPTGELSEYERETDFWWDIENHVMFSFDKMFMNHIHEYVAASLNYMNSRKGE